MVASNSLLQCIAENYSGASGAVSDAASLGRKNHYS
jgi:hypothetical protein